MGLVKKIKVILGNFLYNKRLAVIKHHKKTINLSDAKRIGLLYVVTDETSYEHIVRFIKKLQHLGITINALGFVMKKDVPEFFSSSNAYSFFTLKELNWLNIPNGTFINNFLNEQFDIVINLSLIDTFPLQYITGLSKSYMKVGKYADGNSRYYDIMIETDKINDMSIFVQEVTHYLSILKSKQYV